MTRLALALLVLAGCGASSQPNEPNRATSPAVAPSRDANPTTGAPGPSAVPARTPDPAAPPKQPRHPVQVVASDLRGCAVFDNGMLQCWGGFNYDGELGLGHKKTVKVPGWVEGIHDVRKLALAGHRTCATVG